MTFLVGGRGLMVEGPARSPRVGPPLGGAGGLGRAGRTISLPVLVRGAVVLAAPAGQHE
jgi:hypothetical protein